jgi:transcriptional regulator with XRE-family HTH domain
MTSKSTLLRKAHFLGTKIRNLRKGNHLTLEDLSVRCIQIDANAAPSVSYLSMVENGKRVPSEQMLAVIAEVFQKSPAWFMDESIIGDPVVSNKKNQGGIPGVALEPEFLFSKQQLQTAIPEMLSQTGTSGRQFAQLLIRAHQESRQNHFPDLEKAAEEVGQRRMPLSVSDVYAIAKSKGLKIKWFNRLPDNALDVTGNKVNTLVRSFLDAPDTVYMNEALKQHPARLKFDLASHIGRNVLYGNENSSANIAVAGMGIADVVRNQSKSVLESMSIDSNDILQAWRDFECSFFAGALLCPKAPFKQHLERSGYAVNANDVIEVSHSVYMRRMTSVSPYPHWHYFDAYPPGKLKAVYRGNGIPLPWGNMRSMQDPCQHWAVFRMLNSSSAQPASQISILNCRGEPHIYACESVLTLDLVGNKHVLCAGVDLSPAIESQGKDAVDIAEQLKASCLELGGSGPIPEAIKRDLLSVARVLNISWVEKGLDNGAIVICARGGACPRDPECAQQKPSVDNMPSYEDIRLQIIESAR